LCTSCTHHVCVECSAEFDGVCGCCASTEKGFVRQEVEKIEKRSRKIKNKNVEKPKAVEPKIVTNVKRRKVHVRNVNKTKNKSVKQIHKVKKLAEQIRDTQFSSVAKTGNFDLSFSDKQLIKLHGVSHAPTNRILRFLLSTVPIEYRKAPKTKAALKAIGKRLEEIRARCSCATVKLPQEGNYKPSLSLRVSQNFNDEIHIDIIYLTSDLLESLTQHVRVLSITDRATGLTEFAMLRTRKNLSYEVARAFFLSWGKTHGIPAHVVWSDLGSEFVGDHFLQFLESFGVLKLAGAPRASASRGAVEVKNRFIRQTLRRMSSELGLEVEDLDILLVVCTNECNNCVQKLSDGSLTCPSLRLFGRLTSLVGSHALNDSPTTAEQPTLDFLQIAEKAKMIWQREISCTKLRKFLQSSTEPFKSAPALNTLVYYLADEKSKRWRGPGVVVGYNAVGNYVFVDHGGNLLHVHLHFLKPVESAVLAEATDTARATREHTHEQQFQHAFSPTEFSRASPTTRARSGRKRTSSTPTSAKKRSSSATFAKKRSPFASSAEKRNSSVPAPLPYSAVDFANSHPVPDSPISVHSTPHSTCSPACPAYGGKHRKHTCRKVNRMLTDLDYEGYPDLDYDGYSDKDFVVGGEVSLWDGAVRKNAQIVSVNDACGTLRVRPHGDAHTSIVLTKNVRKVRLVRTVNGEIFANNGVESTSMANANMLVLHRREALRAAAQAEDSEKMVELTANGRRRECIAPGKCLLDERCGNEFLIDDAEISTDFGSDSDGESDAGSERSDITVHAMHRTKIYSKSRWDSDVAKDLTNLAEPSTLSYLKDRKFQISSDAAGVNFDDLPEAMKADGRQKALNVFAENESWEDTHNLEYWKRERSRRLKAGLSPVVILDSRFVEKAIVDESAPDNGALGKLRAKVRLTPRGFREKDLHKKDVTSPTIHSATLRLVEGVCQSQKGFIKLKVDYKDAFFQNRLEIPESEKIMIMVLPESVQNGKRGDQRTCKRLLKEVPGTKTAPQNWFLTIRAAYAQCGFIPSRIDPCLFLKHKDGRLVAAVAVHVDDSAVWILESEAEKFKKSIQELVKVRYIQEVKENVATDLLGLSWLLTSEGTYLSQRAYIERKLKPIDVTKIQSKDFSEAGSIKEGTPLYREYRNRLGGLIWIEKTRLEYSFDISILASSLKILSMVQIRHINTILKDAIDTKHKCLFLPKLPGDMKDYFLQGITDASVANRHDEASQGARIIGVMSKHSTKICCVDCSSRKVRRVNSSSFDSELLTLVEALDVGIVIGLLLEELCHGTRPSLTDKILLECDGIQLDRESCKSTLVLHTDSKDSVERIYSLKSTGDVSKRRRIDISDVQETLVHKDLAEVQHICGSTNPLDVLTKRYGTGGLSKMKATYQRFLSILYDGQYIADLTSIGSSKEKKNVRVCRCEWCI